MPATPQPIAGQPHHFTVRWPIPCDSCGKELARGSTAYRDEDDQLLCEDCTPTELDMPRPTTCPTCFQVLAASGTCGWCS